VRPPFPSPQRTSPLPRRIAPSAPRALPPPRYDGWYSFDQLTDYLNGAVAARPDCCKLHSLGRTPESRDLWMLEVTDFATGAPEHKPGFLVHGNIHAKEVAGCTAALQLIHDLLTGTPDDLDVKRLLNEVVFYVIPRLNPDGAEFALTTGGEIRSRIDEPHEPNALYQQDVDGDGWILSMRIERPDGDMKISKDDPRSMVPRKPEDADGPFFKVYPEGAIDDYDGGEIRRPVRSHDFNRNWPANWAQEHEQGGAGDFPFSEPEMRALADFVYAHPNIFGILGFHCGTNGILTPPSTGSEEDIPAADRKVFKDLGARAAELCGFGMRATIDYRHDSQPPISLRGHSADWGYQHLGLFHFEIELGNIYNAAGMTQEEFFAAEPDERPLWELDALRYHDEHPEHEMFVDWHEFEHPQLGRVEIGGWKRFWLISPSLDELRERIAPGSARFIMEYAERHAAVCIRHVTVDRLDGSIYRVRATVANSGAFPTNVSQHGLSLKAMKPVTVELITSGEAEVVSRRRYQEIGHLAGLTGSRELEWFIRGEEGARLTIRASSDKGGIAEEQVLLG